MASLLSLLSLVAMDARADWRQDLGTFRVGLSASDTAQIRPEDIEKIKQRFSLALKMPVEIVILRDYPALIDAQVSSRIEYAVYTSLAYASAWLLCQCVEPLVAPVQLDGSLGIRSVLVLNAGTPFTRLDLNGIKIGIPGKDSVSGFGIPLAEYSIGSRTLSADEKFFRNFPDAAEMAAAFSQSRIDGFFGWVNADAKGPVEESGLMASGVKDAVSVDGRQTEVKTLWTSSLLRFGPHAVRRNLQSEAKEALRSLFAQLDQQGVDLFSQLPPSNVGRFIPVTQTEYQTAIAAAKALSEVAK